jgi:Putative transposase
VTVIQRASSDLRCNPHFHSLFLDGTYGPGQDKGGVPVFHPAPGPTQHELEAVVQRASKRILRFLEKRGVITLMTAPGDGEVNVVCDDAAYEEDPLLARLLAAATTGAPPAGPAQKRAPVRIALDPQAGSLAKDKLCGQHAGFNLHAATRVAANDKPGRETLCRYILRPPLANDRLHILPDGRVQLSFKRPWSDGTSSVALAPLALIARLAAIVPPPRRHVTRYFGVLSSHSNLRSLVVPPQPPPAAAADRGGDAEEARSPGRSRYILWAELLRRTWGIDVLTCKTCGGRMRLIAPGQDRGTDQEDPGRHGPAHLTAPSPSRPPAACARGWWRCWREQAELTAPQRAEGRGLPSGRAITSSPSVSALETALLGCSAPASRTLRTGLRPQTPIRSDYAHELKK